VRAHHHTAFEAQHDVLAMRRHRFEQAAVDLLGDALGLRSRMRRARLDALADQNLEPRCGPVDGVALGHANRHRNGRLGA
jgi:hypothetical protein